jgi:hypothetical protein
MEFERDKMNPKLTQNYWTQNLAAFEEFPHALSSPPPLSRAANKPVIDDAHMDPEFSPNHWNKTSIRFGENYSPKKNQKLAKEDEQLDFVW